MRAESRFVTVGRVLVGCLHSARCFGLRGPPVRRRLLLMARKTVSKIFTTEKAEDHKGPRRRQVWRFA
jgi:hypothetical protein